jgi:Fe-S-cluster-containing hydrogenase component 2
MALRNIIKINEEKCNGCGKCAKACVEGAIEIISDKARLVSEIYCDGLGACIGSCPQDAITIEKRDAAQFDEEATKKHLEEKQQIPFVCPGIAARKSNVKLASSEAQYGPTASKLSNWPVQLKLVPVKAPFFDNADLLLVADCVPFAMGDFHDKLLKEHIVAVGCPKLDDVNFYIDKLADILKQNNIKSLTVIHIEVPCCSGLTNIAVKAIELSKKIVPFEDITISLQGQIIKKETVQI